MTKEFIALDNGTMSNPYRWLEKGQSVQLNDEQAAFYEKSKWLRPAAEVRGKPVPPIMSHTMKVVSRVAQPFVAQSSEALATDSYNANIAAMQKREANEDGKKTEPVPPVVLPEGSVLAKPGGDAAPAAGTGNQDAF